MTIEGMRADMDTAQRKFDLEKLFVPLAVAPLPPDIPLTDPDRETKLQQWRSKHADPIAFSDAFEKNKKMGRWRFSRCQVAARLCYLSGWRWPILIQPG
jgi:hypothetical protein